MKYYMNYVDDYGQHTVGVKRGPDNNWYFTSKALLDENLRYNTRTGIIEIQTESGEWDNYINCIYQLDVYDSKGDSVEVY